MSVFSPDELEKFKQEMSKRQAIEQGEDSSSSSASSRETAKPAADSEETQDAPTGAGEEAKGLEVNGETPAAAKKIGNSVMVEGIALA